MSESNGTTPVASLEPDHNSPTLDAPASPESSAAASPASTSKSKIDVLLKATGDAPIMKKKKWAVERTKKIGGIVEFIRKFIKCDPSESLFLYVNQSFAPALDVEVGTLYDIGDKTDSRPESEYARFKAPVTWDGMS